MAGVGPTELGVGRLSVPLAPSVAQRSRRKSPSLAGSRHHSALSRVTRCWWHRCSSKPELRDETPESGVFRRTTKSNICPCSCRTIRSNIGTHSQHRCELESPCKDCHHNGLADMARRDGVSLWHSRASPPPNIQNIWIPGDFPNPGKSQTKKREIARSPGDGASSRKMRVPGPMFLLAFRPNPEVSRSRPPPVDAGPRCPTSS